MRTFIILLIIYSLPVYAGTVYKSVDAEGNIIFTDQPSEGAEVIEIERSQSITPVITEPYQYTPARKEIKKKLYTNLEVISPSDDSTVHNNQGNVSISVNVEPAILPGHQMILFVDGEKITTSKTNQFSLSNIDRGTHQLSVVIISEEGKPLLSSETTTFHLRRVSDLAPSLRPDPRIETPINPPKPGLSDVLPADFPTPNPAVLPADQPDTVIPTL
jgi:uncharacterized protein DUF4124